MVEGVKYYSVEDIINSIEPRDIEIPWKDGFIRFRLKPLRFGEFKIIMRASGSKDPWEQSTELIINCVKQLVDDGSGTLIEKDLEKKVLSRLPTGFVTKLMDEINRHSGLTADIEELKNLYETMRRQRQ